MTKFELARLLDSNNESLVEELKRVAKLVESTKLTTKAFDKFSKVNSSTIRRRFNGWRNALENAGLGHRYSGIVVTDNMKKQGTKSRTDEEIIQELIRVSGKLHRISYTAKTFDEHSRIHSSTVVRHFGSWADALIKAGLTPGRGARRYTEEDYFENILNVWTYYGRQPKYKEMDISPSVISSGAYEAKWGKWSNALRSFLEKMDHDARQGSMPQEESHNITVLEKHVRSNQAPQTERRPISLGLRYDVLRRDRFRCSICGASPATNVQCKLHVDHINPVSKGGLTIKDNLRTLCSHCNIGKGAKVE